MPDFEQLIAGIASALEGRQLPYLLIGGQAVLLHGEPRLTQDIDITLGVGPDQLAEVLTVCESLALKPLPEDLAGFVSRTFVLPALDESSGIRVDFIFSTTPYEQQAISRAEQVEMGGTSVAFAAAEDLILHKLFAGRPRDLEDVRGVVRRKGHDLDWDYLAEWAKAFSVVPERESLPELVRELQRAAGRDDD